METAFKYVEATPLDTEAAYPYTSIVPEHNKCRASGTGPGKVTSCNDVTPLSVAALKAAIAKGPVSVNVEADKDAFQQYDSGVLTSKKCGIDTDHAILAIGYGTDPDHGEYFLCKNSWGLYWGDDGFVKIAATAANICGILVKPSYPNL